jgi:hypothetical protein
MAKTPFVSGHDEAHLYRRGGLPVAIYRRLFMSRQKLSRRFEPRYGVSQSMLEAECKWVERELDDHMIRSVCELSTNLSNVRAKAETIEETLRTMLACLPGRERLALKGMLARDVYHIAVLYEKFLRLSQTVQQATGTAKPTPEERDENDDPRPVLVFNESLFD